MKNMNKFKITLEYLGSGFHGFQRQDNVISIQEVLETAIENLTKEKVITYAAGRTDAGVHAYGQVVHFDLKKDYQPYQLMQSLNHFMLPNPVGIIHCEKVNTEFHARFSAICRHYVYKIKNRSSVIVIDSGLKYLVREKLNIETMQIATNYLIGKYDFTSFRSSICQSSSPIKTISNIKIKTNADDIEIYVSAKSFLHHMVRNIVGTLIDVGLQKYPPEYVKAILENKNRCNAGATAPAHGLYFLRVDY